MMKKYQKFAIIGCIVLIMISILPVIVGIMCYGFRIVFFEYYPIMFLPITGIGISLAILTYTFSEHKKNGEEDSEHKKNGTKETWVERLLVGIFISIIVWTGINIYQYYNNRSNIERAVLLNINVYTKKIKEQQGFCDKYFKKQLNENKPIVNLIRYSMDYFDIYKIMLPQIINYCSERNIIKIINYYNALDEYNFLMEGLCNELVYYKKNGIIIKADDLTYFHDKNDRINKIVKIITQKKYESIEDLPNDYREEVHPETLVK